jgi:S1-C subfamily serine protease
MTVTMKKFLERAARSWLAALLAAAALVAPARGGEPDPRRDAAVEAIARVMPSVVNIGTETIVEVRDPFEGLLREFWGPYYRRQPQEAQYSLGSGVIIDEAGYVLTNDHVVRRASRIWVKLSEESGGKEYEAERVAGTTRSDVALLRLLAKPGERFKAVRFAADDDLLLGETVLALGNPFGLGGSVSRGILSSKSRRPAVENAPMGLEDWLQTDAAINPGNSGGPLVNVRGELIGISVAVYREGQGIGFAIPIKRVTEGLSEIFSPERAQLWLGARIRPGGGTLIVSAVEAGSPAERAGLRVGDIVTSVNGKSPQGYIEFIQALNAAGDRQDVALAVQRGGVRQAVTLRLMREGAVFNAGLIRQKLGLSAQEITPDLAERMGLLTNEGLLVSGVDADGPAKSAGLQRGHILLGIQGQPAENIVTAAKILYARKKGEKVALDVLVRRQRGVRVFAERWGIELAVR